jgi:hypothetical protein
MGDAPVLEARLFMRGDARVFVRLDRTLVGKSAEALTKKATEKAADELLLVAKRSEPASAATRLPG